MAYRYVDHDVAKAIRAWGGALGDGTSARVDGGALELRRGWRAGRVAGWIAAASSVAGATLLAATCYLVIAHDRFPSMFELSVSLVPAGLVAAIGTRLGRPRVVRVEGAARSVRIRGAEYSLLGETLSLTRTVWDRNTVDVELAIRSGASLVTLHGVRPLAAGRMKAIAIAVASWVGAPLVETSTDNALEILHDADARFGLAVPRPREPGSMPVRSPQALETAVDVAVCAVQLLDAL